MTIENGVMKLSGVFQLKGGTREAMSVANPMLASREIAVETDTGQMKVGNGFNRWADLPYVNSLPELTSSITMVRGVVNTPDANPALGDCYIVGTSPTGAFEGATSGDFARYDGSQWGFSSPTLGVEVINLSNGQLLRYVSSGWTQTASFNISGV